MAWTRIDDEFRTNIKIRKAGPDGVLLYLFGLVYCNTNLTDGYIDNVFLPQILADAFCKTPKATVKKLIDCGLWIEIEGGYQVNDFLEYNFSKEEVEKRRQARSAAGRKGGLSKAGGKFPDKDEADFEADAQANAKANAQADFNPITHNPLIKESTTTTTHAREEISEVVKAYESEIGVLTGMIREKLVAALDEYPADWIINALEESALQNARNWKYAEAILKRWKVDGFQVDTRTKRDNNRKPTKQLSAGLDEILADAPIFAEDK